MKVRIDWDELYPYYVPSTSYGVEIDLTIEQYERMLAVDAEFRLMQEAIGELVRARRNSEEQS